MRNRVFAFAVMAMAALCPATPLAAPVDIYVTADYQGSYRIAARASVDTGQIALRVRGFTSMTFAPLPQISLPDSVLKPAEDGWANLVITSAVGQDLIPIGAGVILLATLHGQWFAPPGSIQSGDDTFAYTALNQALTEPIGYALYATEDPDGPLVLVDSWEPVPEPALTALVAVGLVALKVARRASL